MGGRSWLGGAKPGGGGTVASSVTVMLGFPVRGSVSMEGGKGCYGRGPTGRARFGDACGGGGVHIGRADGEGNVTVQGRGRQGVRAPAPSRLREPQRRGDPLLGSRGSPVEGEC